MVLDHIARKMQFKGSIIDRYVITQTNLHILGLYWKGKPII